MCLRGTVSVRGHECECEFVDILTWIDLWTHRCALDEDQHGTGRSHKIIKSASKHLKMPDFDS